MTEKKTVTLNTEGDVISYAVSFAMESMVQRGKLSQEQSEELARLSDKAYMALVRGEVLFIENGEITTSPRPTETGTLVIGE